MPADLSVDAINRRDAAEAIARHVAPISQVLELSALHLSTQLRADLNGPGVYATPLPEGWLLAVPDDPDVEAEHWDGFEGGMPPVVLDLCRYAHRLGCDRILFDWDVPIVDWVVRARDGELLDPPAVWPDDRPEQL